MKFRQNGQRDERRRRVLRDELLTPAAADDETTDSGDGSPDSAVPTPGYSAAVSLESQPPISLLIATRPWTLSVLVLAGLAVIAGLQAGYANLVHGSTLATEITIALDVAAPGSLAAWFSTLLLSMAAVNAALVYWLRSHKLDDYRGRYRVWLWTCLGLVIAAVDASTGLHIAAAHLMAVRFETPWLQNPTLNGVVVLSTIFGCLAVRLAFEIWSSRLARACAVLATAGYLTAIFIRTELLVIDSVLLTAMAESTALLLANLATAFTVASYCRYVYLESQNALKPRRQRRSKRSEAPRANSDEPQAEASDRQVNAADKPAAAKSAKRTRTKPEETVAPSATLRTKTINSKSIRCDSAHQTLGEAKPAKSAPAKTPSATEEYAAEDEGMLEFDPETGENLSKAERRRQRKLMRRQKKTGSG